MPIATSRTGRPGTPHSPTGCADADLIVSAGFMKLVGPAFLAAHGGRMINSHPSLLPSFPGMHAPQDALDYGVTVTGCTIFLVDAGVDAGPIVAQQAVPVRPTTPSTPCTNGSRWPNGPAGLSGDIDGRARLARHRTKGAPR